MTHYLKFTIPLLLVIILFGYTNCGQLSHNNKTSTQAINPGDFGGEQDDFRVIGSQALTNLGIRICNKKVALNRVMSFESCAGVVYQDEPTSGALDSIGVGRTLDQLIILARQGQVVVNTRNIQICFYDIDNFQIDSSVSTYPVYGTKDLSIQTESRPNYDSELAVQIIMHSLACRSLFGEGTTF